MHDLSLTTEDATEGGYTRLSLVDANSVTTFQHQPASQSL